MRDFQQVESIIDVSAKIFLNIPELCFCIQRVILYPTPPLYDIHSQQITPKFERALNLIFRIIDVDQDFCLSDHELNEFHLRVYSNELSNTDIDGIKEVVNAHCREGIDEKGVSAEGFKSMQILLLQKTKVNLCWQVLEAFGFDSKLNLKWGSLSSL